MLTGAGLSRLWPHDRVHYFFSRARWSPGDLGLRAAKLVIALLVPDREPVEVLIDDTNAPWYTSKTEPSTADMTAKLRRVIIAAKFKRVYADQPEPAEIHAIRLAWEDAEDLAA